MAKTLFTIGYEKSTPKALIAALEKAKVRTLIDVRAVPASRRAGFSKRALAAKLEEAGIAYCHLRDLGTPKAGRDAARAGKTATMHRIFHAHMEKAEAQVALGDAVRIAKESPSCLLCLERNHDECHRAIVSEMMARRAKFKVVALKP